ncbi:MAG: ABC transporter permease [Actinomycetota bacterium]|nr:ABC transporter permease [Actinomycetota bacterium]
MIDRIREIARYRGVLTELVRRDLRVRYEDTWLGYFWAVFEPLLMTLVYFVVFTIVGRFGIENYALYLILGLLPWMWFVQSISAGTKSLTARAGLLSKIYVPREIAPLSVVASKAVEYAVSIPVAILFIVITGQSPSWFVAAVPLAWLLQLMFVTGAVLMLSAANMLVRDVERVLRVITRAMFYGTPILYSLQSALDGLPAYVTWLYWINPMTGILELHHAAFYPDMFAGWGIVATSTGISTLFFVLGWVVFTRLEPLVLKEL